MCNLYFPCEPYAFLEQKQNTQTSDLLLASSFHPTVWVNSAAATLSWSSSTGSRYINPYESFSQVFMPEPFTYNNALAFIHQYNYTLDESRSYTGGEHTSSCSSPDSSASEFCVPLLEKPKMSRRSMPLPKSFICLICSHSFARKHDLQRHIRVHTGAKPYACLNCKKAFARTDALKRHLRMEDTCRTSPAIQAMKTTGSRRYRNL